MSCSYVDVLFYCRSVFAQIKHKCRSFVWNDIINIGNYRCKCYTPVGFCFQCFTVVSASFSTFLQTILLPMFFFFAFYYTCIIARSLFSIYHLLNTFCFCVCGLLPGIHKPIPSVENVINRQQFVWNIVCSKLLINKLTIRVKRDSTLVLFA